MDCAANELLVYEFGDSEDALVHTKTVPLLNSARHEWADTQAFDSPEERERQPLALYS